MAEYDAIARGYQESKQLPFRDRIERYTLFELLGDIAGTTVLDLACGDGFYTRLLRRAGASEVTGVDISRAMIELAEEQERRHPLGCRYVQADVAAYEPGERVDLVVAVYLFNYAKTPGELRRFCQVCHDALLPGGRLVGLNNNVHNLSADPPSFRKYGLERTWESPLAEGDAVRYTMINADGREIQFDNFYLKPATHAAAFEHAGFRDFRWIDVSLHPAETGNPFWDDFMAEAPIIAFAAER
ncbi:MAG: class I SAM-dependent methyltransferase [Gammaproteobacteria bacterium]|nr:class I SAM-dependent methyltransferase [Gammaproteobacteria bacterium]